MGLNMAMTLIFEFSRSYVILTIWWPRLGVRIYQIVTGVTSDVGVPSTHLVWCIAGLAISSTPPEKSGNFRGKNRPGRNMFLPPILEETKNWWNISILAHVASWLDTPKENLELWLVEIGKNNIYSNLSLDLYILCHFNYVSGKFTICYYNITILFRKYIKIRFTVLLSQLQNLGLHLKSIHLNIMTHCNFVQSAN